MSANCAALQIVNKFKHFISQVLSPVCYGFLCGGDPVATHKETMAKIKLGKRTLDNLPRVAKRTTFFDTDLTGFGIRVSPSGARSWIIEYRPGSGGRGVSKRRMVLGTRLHRSIG